MSRHHDQTVNGRPIRALLIFRLILVSLILGTIIYIFGARGPDVPLLPLYVLLTFTYAISALYWLALKREMAPTFLIYLQLSIDVALVTGMLLYSGGSESILTLLYLLLIISSSIFLRFKGVLYICTMSAAAYWLLSRLQHQGVLKVVSFFEPGRQLQVPPQMAIDIYVNICFFYLVAFLSGFLAEQLRRKGEELESTSQKLRRIQLDTDDILENIPSGLITLDGRGTIQYFNGAAEKILGLDRGYVKGVPYHQVFKEDNAELKDVLRSALEEAMVYERKELMALSKEGRSMPLGISTTLLGVGKGDRSGVIAIFQDLTQAKEMDQRIRQADRMAVLGQLSAAIAHEIRNPLATISGSIEVLLESAKFGGEEQKLMQLATRESDRLNRIITDFLLYARIRPADKTVVDIHKMVDETLTLVRNHDDFHKGIEIVNQVPERQAHVLADQDQIKQIFLNIAINALQAMPQGGRLTVGLGHHDTPYQVPGRNGMIPVFFQDTGMGIPPEELKNVFEPFYSSKKDGTGLGLSIAQRIVENNGGRLEVDSQVKRGTTFVVWLLSANKDDEGNDETA